MHPSPNTTALSVTPACEQGTGYTVAEVLQCVKVKNKTNIRIRCK